MRSIFLVVAALAAGCGFLPVDQKNDGLLPISRPPASTERDQCAAPARLSEVRVNVETGTLEGQKRGEATVYLGVPYAAAPIGELRFRAPQAAACWNGVRDATRFASLCAQPGANNEPVGSEDCLYLNVFAPSALPVGKRPVLVFLHGGDGRTGGSHSADGTAGQLDGAAFAAAEDAVVVTLDWRLGALGFTSHPVLRAENAGAGNYGLLDTVAALQWVKRNAAAFGGDASRVLVFGEGAGAQNVCALLAVPQARGLFTSALMQSGACAATGAAVRDEQGRGLADALGCDGDVAACLRAASAADLATALPLPAPLLASWHAAFGPTVDGLVLPEAPLSALEGGRAAQVPLAVGSNADEFALFLPDEVMPTCGEYAPYLASVFGPLAAQVEARYPCDAQRGAAVTAVAAVTDALYTCPARRAARAASAGQTQPVYRYLYAHSRAYGPLATLRAFHSAELPYLFDTLGLEGYQPTQSEVQLSRAMQGYWTSFARGEEPRARFGPQWQRYSPSMDDALVLQESVRQDSVAARAACDFWDSVSP
jgi:para-nitrobenzyl esterase